jgi:glucose-6-phosphate 1-epimerase
MTASFLDLVSPDGANARVSLLGGQLLSWCPNGVTDSRLWMSPRAAFRDGQAIRGGVPICFPQFGAAGPLRAHGFARLMPWSVERVTTAEDGARALLRLSDTDATRAEWPYAFAAELSVHVMASTLAIELTVHNTDGQPFSFTAALHPYFAVSDVRDATVHGLAGTTYRDALRLNHEDQFTESLLVMGGPIDRVHANAADQLELVTPSRTLRLEKRGFPDAVVWNPGTDSTHGKADLTPDDARHFVCVEPAAVSTPVELAPGAQWTGTLVVTELGAHTPV